MNAVWPSLLAPSRHGRDELCAVSAHGVRVRFADGRELLCGSSGLWNTALGYGNEVIADAIARAVRDASYLSVFRYENAYARRAAEALVDLCGSDHFSRVLFSTSGGAANDLAMKLARQLHALRGEPQRTLVVGLRTSYHGLTFGGFALSGGDMGQRMYGVDQRLIRHVSPNAVDELNALFARQGGQIAAVVVEPVLGNGAVPLDEEFLAELLRLREQHGFLLVADEVATGFARTGPYFASSRWPRQPDLLILSKALTNGTCAAAAVLVARGVDAAFTDADAVFVHAETQAGTPMTCAAILATLEEMRRLDAEALSHRLSSRLDAELKSLGDRLPLLTVTEGVGCFRYLGFGAPGGGPLTAENVADLVAAIREAGAIVHPGPQGVQLIPALIYTDEDLDELLDCVARGAETFFAGLGTSAGGGR
ncbi:daptide-type RiPP biosynthesis aminotransferase [Kitasatospora sp. GP82]|uniref:daptide-type RiPP biosynthesis aminotransferase n=1 Tax=Kitasatospora sp. GP82 TaxID=3035089 RepID=UPI0024759221|nr:daptide-type RiPP biosynthesis aminotransferase [Kitasatospora sp. GP82]MDH6126930.1 adenosylmethionine-8-amino-7-oxononanoate aminotransferase [Kitasatospora sp. GP82]